MSTFSGETTLLFYMFASIFRRGQLIKERICSLKSKFFSLLVDLILEPLSYRGSKQKVTKIIQSQDIYFHRHLIRIKKLFFVILNVFSICEILYNN